MRKKGISLIVLAITIIVLAILVGIIITGTSIATQNAKMQTLANELLQIEDVLSTSKSLGTELPIKDDSIVHTLETLKTLVGVDYATALEAEVKVNKDEADTFRVIDMQKLGAKVSSKGSAKDSGADIFIFAEKSLNVYYVRGVHVGGQSYFSLTESLTNLVKIDQNTDVGTENPDITVTIPKEYRVSLVTEEKANEVKISIEMPKTTKVKVNLSLTQTSGAVVDVDITDKIIDGIYTYKVDNTAGITKEVINLNKQLKFKFIDTSGNTSKQTTVEVKVTNIDVDSPSKPTMIRSVAAGVNNVLEIQSSSSDVSYYAYDYYTKKDSSGVEKSIYLTNATTEEQKIAGLMSKGLKSQDGIIKLPKYITSIIVIAVDEAGNTSNTSICKVDDSIVIPEL